MGGHGFVRAAGGVCAKDDYYIFLWAYKNPFVMAASELQRTVFAHASSDNRRDNFEFEFKEVGKYIFSTQEMHDWDIEQISVLPHITYVGERLAATEFSPIALVDFLGALPPPPIVRGRRQDPAERE